MAGLGKKPVLIASDDVRRLLDQLSKAALIDMCWCLAGLGTNESADQILTKLAREVLLVTDARHDATPQVATVLAQRRIDSDPLD